MYERVRKTLIHIGVSLGLVVLTFIGCLWTAWLNYLPPGHHWSGTGLRASGLAGLLTMFVAVGTTYVLVTPLNWWGRLGGVVALIIGVPFLISLFHIPRLIPHDLMLWDKKIGEMVFLSLLGPAFGLIGGGSIVIFTGELFNWFKK